MTESWNKVQVHPDAAVADCRGYCPTLQGRKSQFADLRRKKRAEEFETAPEFLVKGYTTA